MENASKALLIAGAILLVIALIAIGMVILGQGRSITNQAGTQANALKIQSHNTIVEPYVGTRVPASSVMTLISAVLNNNNNDGRLETITLNGDTTTVQAVTNMNATYTVTITDVVAAGENTGAINSITINRNGAAVAP